MNFLIELISLLTFAEAYRSEVRGIASRVVGPHAPVMSVTKSHVPSSGHALGPYGTTLDPTAPTSGPKGHR